MGHDKWSSKSTPQLQKHIRTSAEDTTKVAIVVHASVRMRQRKISRLEVFECLRRGIIRRAPEPDLKTADLRCRMEHYVAGRDISVIVALSDERPDLLVVTVFYNE